MVDRALEPHTRTCAAGTVLFEEGEPGERMYVIESGRVQVIKRIGDAQVVLANLGPGDSVGEMALLDGQPRSADAVVAAACELLVIERDHFEQLIRENGEIAVRLMRKLSQRLREANRQLEGFLAQSGSGTVVQLLRGLADEPGADGWRALSADATPQALAARAGLGVQEARAVFERLRAAQIVRERDGELVLAPESTLDEYRDFLELKQRYDPLTALELAEMTGMPEEEVHRVVRKVLANRLQEAADDPLVDSYQHYLSLKKRFEYLDRA